VFCFAQGQITTRNNGVILFGTPTARKFNFYYCIEEREFYLTINTTGIGGDELFNFAEVCTRPFGLKRERFI
jgi:hypothetical protein